MEEIYANVDYFPKIEDRLNIEQTDRAPRSSKRFSASAVLCLGLLNIFLLVGLIGLGLVYQDLVARSAAKLSTIRTNLTELLQISNDKLSSLSEERDLLNTNLTYKTKELERLVAEQKKTCPEGWKRYNFTCYFLSTGSDSWVKGMENCKVKDAHLVVISSDEEQRFLHTFTNEQAWIGLSDREVEGTFKWIDGSALTLKYWNTNEPNDSNQREDCVHIKSGTALWNDAPCETSKKWICEKNL